MTHCTVEVIGTANKKKKENLVGGQYINKTIILDQSKKNQEDKRNVTQSYFLNSFQLIFHCDESIVANYEPGQRRSSYS